MHPTHRTRLPEEILEALSPATLEVFPIQAHADVAKGALALRDLRAAKDAAYRERDWLVAALAAFALGRGHDAAIVPHEGEPFEPGWNNVVCVVLSDRRGNPLQMSWHVHDDELPLFGFLPELADATGTQFAYDGHTTPQKYERLLTFLRGYFPASARGINPPR